MEELQRFSDLGIPPNATAEAQWQRNKTQIDKKFEQSATPVFYTMLSLSIATFFAAFIQASG
jgi:uncharacterized membrane protein YidH (DUF202 family)